MVKEILLTRGMVTLVDDEDYEYLNQVKWFAHPHGKTAYVHRNIPKQENHKRTTIKMHRIIMVPTPGKEIDHIDGNGLNNQKSNLRLVTHRENGQNRHQKKSSRFPGVCWSKRGKNWIARIKIKGKSKHLGTFNNEEKAFEAYKKAVNELMIT